VTASRAPISVAAAADLATEGTARILHGGPIAADIRSSVAAEVQELGRQFGAVPGIAILLIGDDPASHVYARRILRNAESVDLPGRLVHLPASTPTVSVVRELRHLNADPSIGGIIVQMPLPARFPLRAIIEAIDPRKDIDGIHALNAGNVALGYPAFVPSCAEAAVEIPKRYGYVLEGMRAVVIGRSNVVGKPAHLLLMREHATVTVCHRRTRDLPGEVRTADLVVVAAGAPGLVTGEMLKPGALVIDCGINVVAGEIVGDVDRASAERVAGALTPVPGGVGPVTNAVLLEHLVRAARAQLEAGERMPGDAGATASGSTASVGLAAAG
jgi:methylenetetrahydrofolate dehydrogenase (NADP+)/methenyltetrahydrofolate cyclohydrolase